MWRTQEHNISYMSICLDTLQIVPLPVENTQYEFVFE